MSTLEGDMMQPDRVGDDDPPAPEETTEQAETEQAAPPADDDISDADVIEVPDSSAQDGKVKLVPLSAVTTVRAKLSKANEELASTRTSAARSTELEGQIAQLQGQLQQYAPVVQAYNAMVAQQQAPPPQAPQDSPEAMELARNLDLYTADGKPDAVKAAKILGMMGTMAQSAAQQHVQPLAQHTVSQQAHQMFNRALNTKAPDGSQPHPDDLKAVWSRLDPSVTATVDGAKQVWIQALGMSQLAGRAIKATTTQQGQRATNGQFLKADIPAPLHTEKAGGKDSPEAATLSEAERKYIKSEGITEAEYLKSQPAWMRR